MTDLDQKIVDRLVKYCRDRGIIYNQLIWNDHRALVMYELNGKECGTVIDLRQSQKM